MGIWGKISMAKGGKTQGEHGGKARGIQGGNPWENWGKISGGQRDKIKWEERDNP